MNRDADLAGELSRRWHELGGVLRSRRLLAVLHHGSGGRLTPTNLRALDVLADADGLPVGELAARVGIDDTTASRLADRLEAAGVAERRRSPHDRRVAVVALTREGAELARLVREQRRRFFADVLAALEPRERAELVRLTGKAADALRATSEELIAR
jgi:DNA-binding MarR family transcriptional regulator